LVAVFFTAGLAAALVAVFLAAGFAVALAAVFFTAGLAAALLVAVTVAALAAGFAALLADVAIFYPFRKINQLENWNLNFVQLHVAMKCSAPDHFTASIAAFSRPDRVVSHIASRPNSMTGF
ncbi:MAG: hypothetical protein AB1710_09150, partial [Pseudomonadota bacterium]